MEKTSNIYKDLEKEDFKFLYGLEKGMKRRGWVPKDDLSYLSNLHEQEVEYRLNRLKEIDLIERRGNGDSKLSIEGYDTLALNFLVQNDTISQISSQINAGKESEVYKVKDDDEENFILKVHREGYSDFRNTGRKRQYEGNWREASKEAAKREFKALTRLYDDVLVPKPIDHNRHTLVIELFEGVELSKARLENPRLVFETIVEEISKTWEKGLVHGDISEYNILVSENGIRIIDWPQYVEVDHPNSREFLKRDISNILSQFRNKYPEEEFNKKENIIKKIV